MKPEAFIFDIDGVICDSYKPEFEAQFKVGNFTEFEKGIPTYPSIRWSTSLIKALYGAGFHIIFMTARNEKYRHETIKWISRHIGISDNKYELIMRPEYNRDSDSTLKHFLTEKIINRYNILAAFDDKLRNVLMWQDMGIYTLHVLT